MNKFKHFSVDRRKGIDDLMSTIPYTDGDWPVYNGNFGVTEEEYKADPESYADKVNQYNAERVKELKNTDEYGKISTTHFNMMSIPEFDDAVKTDYSKFQILLPRSAYGKNPENNPDDPFVRQPDGSLLLPAFAYGEKVHIETTQECRMQSPPILFWEALSTEDWKRLANEQQDQLIEIAKYLYNLKK